LARFCIRRSASGAVGFKSLRSTPPCSPPRAASGRPGARTRGFSFARRFHRPWPKRRIHTAATSRTTPGRRRLVHARWCSRRHRPAWVVLADVPGDLGLLLRRCPAQTLAFPFLSHRRRHCRPTAPELEHPRDRAGAGVGDAAARCVEEARCHGQSPFLRVRSAARMVRMSS